MACASNGEVELFIQPVAVAPRLRVYGKTPIAEFAAQLAKEMDFDPLTDTQAEAQSTEPPGRETDAADRETYALIATQGSGDEAALEAALHSNARAVLVIASPRKTARLRETMELRGIARERLDALQAPAGPDIGAVTPNEIALSAIAGLVTLRRGHSPHRDNSNATAKRAGASGAKPIGTGYINPVCGALIDPAHAVSSLTLRGQTHYFCCQGCRTEFERDPEKYLEIGARMRPKLSDASAPTHP
jgi:xanthine dehydrogenase accessory factor